MLNLDERLQALFDMVPACREFADIGCDHGRLGAQLLLAGRVQRVQFSDISAPSMDKARELIRKLELSDRAVFRVGDGAHALVEKPDAAVVAGMGASTISKIISEGADILSDAEIFLQPNLDEAELRACLQENGYAITRERVVRAANRWYVLIAARRGQMILDEKQRIAGTASMREDRQAYEGYAHFRIRVAQKALQGARHAEDGRAQELERAIAIWEEVIR